MHYYIHTIFRLFIQMGKNIHSKSTRIIHVKHSVIERWHLFWDSHGKAQLLLMSETKVSLLIRHKTCIILTRNQWSWKYQCSLELWWAITFLSQGVITPCLIYMFFLCSNIINIYMSKAKRGRLFVVCGGIWGLGKVYIWRTIILSLFCFYKIIVTCPVTAN